MAFDLVNYFAEQIKIQKPALLSDYPIAERNLYLKEMNILSLGKIVSLWKTDQNAVYQEIQSQDHLYIQEIARHLTTSPHNKSTLAKNDMESSYTEILSLQFAELKQLDSTGNFGKNGLGELLLGQIEHLSGHAPDWVWSTNNLKELIGSQHLVQEALSLEDTMKEFNQMVHQTTDLHVITDHTVTEITPQPMPVWGRIAEPLVALVVLWILYSAAQHIFA